MAESSGSSRSVTSIDTSIMSAADEEPAAAAVDVVAAASGSSLNCLKLGVTEKVEAIESLATRGASARLFSIVLSSDRASNLV